jgi:hypothetical protein
VKEWFLGSFANACYITVVNNKDKMNKSHLQPHATVPRGGWLPNGALTDR